MLVAQSVEKSFQTSTGPLPVLRGVDITLAAGETLALTGESGSGKSTFLHLAAGLDTIDGGSIAIGGTYVGGLNDAERAQMRRSRLGLIFQQFNLIPSLSVADNLAFQARLSDRFDADWQARITRQLGLDGLGNRWPEQLSGGQQQRVAVGRTLAARPDLILADEPTGNLDEATGDQVLDLMLDLVRETGAALLMVTHSQRLAARLDRTVQLRQGRLA